MAVSPLVDLLAFARGSRGAAALEFACGAVALISVSVLCFDLYSRVRADTAIARIAVTMADYVSRDADPNGDEMAALGRYLHEHQLGFPAALVYVITALHQPTGDPLPDAVVLWSDSTIRIGDEGTTGRLAADCPRHVAEGGTAALPDGFAMSPEEVIVIAEVCARLTREGFLTGKFIAGDIYRLHALRARDPDRQPNAPAYSRTDGARAIVTVDAARVPGASESAAQSAVKAVRV